MSQGRPLHRLATAARLRLDRGANRLLARPPRFVIVGTGRCGTAYAARRLSDLGIACAHEGYYTPQGPMLRNPVRSRHARGDASWLAVPFLAPGEMPLVHLVRRPADVIRSLFNIGFFDPRWRKRHAPFIAFAERHFRPAGEPFESCVRWYLEWNLHCERLGGLRVPIEAFEESLPSIVAHLGVAATRAAPPPGEKINSRPSVHASPITAEEVEARLARHPCAHALAEMSARYGYAGPTGCA